MAIDVVVLKNAPRSVRVCVWRNIMMRETTQRKHWNTHLSLLYMCLHETNGNTPFKECNEWLKETEIPLKNKHKYGELTLSSAETGN